MRNSRTLLNFLAMLCRSLVWFPLWLLLLVLCPRQPVAAASCLLTAAGILTLWLAKYVRHRLAERPYLRTFCGIAAWLAPAAACIFLLHWMTGAAAVPVILTGFTLTAAVLSRDTAPDLLFSPAVFAAFLTGSLIAPLLLHLAEMPVPLSSFLTVMCVQSVLFLLLRNQFMLLRMVNRRSNTEIDVPAHIRRGNLLILAGVLLLIFCGFLLRRPITAGIHAAGQLLVTIIRVLLRGLVNIVAWLGGNAPDVPEETGFPDEPVQPPAGGASKLWLLLWIPFAAVAYYMWKEFLSDWVWAIREALQKLVMRLTRGRETAGSPDGTAQGYTDIETAAERVQSRRSAERTWRRRLRKWRKMPDSAQKFYDGYTLLLDAPAWKRGVLHASDTAREIREKWASQTGQPEALDAVTADLHADLYAQMGLPTEALRDMEQALNRLRQMHQK